MDSSVSLVGGGQGRPLWEMMLEPRPAEQEGWVWGKRITEKGQSLGKDTL